MSARLGYKATEPTVPTTSTIKNVDTADNGLRCETNFAKLPSSVLAFETRWSEEKRLRDVLSGGSKHHRRNPDDDYFIQKARTRKDVIRRRLEVGFECFGETVGGRYRPPFVEAGLRSANHHLLRRIVQLSPKKDKLQSGRVKDIVSVGDSKLLSLDEPWTALNPVFRAVFRQDLDFTYRSWDALRFEIEQLPLPCLPHLVVAFELPDGRVERPHVLYFLPYGSEVWWAPEDDRCRKDIMGLFKGVHAGITKTYLSLGADPGALSNPMRIKNPLSPFWSYRIWNESIFPDLSEWSGWVDTRTNRDAMIRESAVAISGMDRKASNILFTTFQRMAFDVLRGWHKGAYPAYISAIASDTRETLDELLFSHLVGGASKTAENRKQALAILYRVTAYAAQHWDPTRASRDDNKDRGACSVEVEGLESLYERQAVGGRYGSALRASRTVHKITEAIRALRAEGLPINKKSISIRSGVSRPTVHKHWKIAMESSVA